MTTTIDDDKSSGNEDENIMDKDTTKFTDEQKNDYIDKLKDENARRRIANKKAQENFDKQKKEQETSEKELNDTKEKLKAFEDKEKKKTDKDKTENEKLLAKLAETEKSSSKAKQDLKETNKKLVEKERRLLVQGREVLAERLVRQMKYEFASDYEREGFVNSLTDIKDGEFIFNDEEVILKVKDFVKKKPPETPGAGSKTRMSDTPVVEEIKGLLAKKTLTNEDNKRLDELLKEVE